MRVLLVDDHALFLAGLKNLLTANGLEVVGTASNVRDAWEQTRRLNPEVILMDIQMPGQDGIEITRLIKRNFPNVKIVMLTVFQDDAHLFEAIKAGASGYLSKGLEKEKFLDLLQGMARGESPLSPGMAERVLLEFARLEQEKEERQSPVSIELLSDRQREILKWVAHGLTYKEVGEKLSVSESAVKYHMGEITARLQLENRSQAIALAVKLGLDGNEESE